MVLGVCSVLTLAALAFAAVRLTGGSPNPLNHLGYGPILLGAYLFGWRGGLLAGLLSTVALGPLAVILGEAEGVEGPSAWLSRGVFYVAVGTVTGVLFDRSRAATNAWRHAADTIATREREAIRALGRSAEAKDPATGEHVGRVQGLSEQLALSAGMERRPAADVGWSAVLHDVGKLHVPDLILLKPGPLSAAEWRIMREHSLWGEEILAHGDGFELARRIARWHHENFDGSGYPDRLRHDAIPLEARIVRITDSFDAMTHHRAYREARSVEWALEELDRCSGRAFDPELVALFIELVRSDRRILLP
ncbi:MAG: HD domain-containing protein [Chloroflexota bacterium]|nr:HD domain-containing protein [Chloroflexota bacterium]